MKLFFFAFFILLPFLGFTQEPKDDLPKKSLLKTQEEKAKALAKKAPINLYRLISIEKDTTYVDTSLTIQDEYQYNYLRKDIFGLLPFANEGHTYTTLQYGLKHKHALPEFGFKAKHFNFQDKNQINYYSVATPLTELYFKTVMEQGQSLDALIAVNTSERFNISLSFKGLRSKGKYVNQLTSNGNFRMTSSYNSLNKRYFANFHFTGQDLLSGENGGVIDIENFENQDPAFRDRLRLSVYLSNASTFLKGKRVFLDHNFKLNNNANNSLFLLHQVSLESKFFEFNQPTVQTTYQGNSFSHFGNSFNTSINDQTNLKSSYNKFGIMFQNIKIGKINMFVEDYRYNYYYGKLILSPSGTIPSRIKQNINALGAQYNLTLNKIKSDLLVSKSISSQSFSTINANVQYTHNKQNCISIQYQNVNKLPDNNFTLHQSSYQNYNWYNNFKNEKINDIKVEAKTKWITAEIQFSSLKDHLYFSDNSIYDSIQLIKPNQYSKTINTTTFKINKEIKYWKFALDNTILYQNISQEDKILNLPEFVTRNTLYYSDYFYKRALFLQAGVTFNYFTTYNGDGYNPVLAEFFTQNKEKIGGFSNLDFFVNARVRQTRIFLKAEHFNAAFASTNNFYNAPNYPYRDFIIRFGLVWNFFQ